MEVPPGPTSRLTRVEVGILWRGTELAARDVDSQACTPMLRIRQGPTALLRDGRFSWKRSLETLAVRDETDSIGSLLREFQAEAPRPISYVGMARLQAVARREHRNGSRGVSRQETVIEPLDARVPRSLVEPCATC